MNQFLTFRRPVKVLPVVVSLTIAVSLFPSSWLGWTKDISDLVRVPVTPLSHVGILLTGWMRPAAQLSDLPTDQDERNTLAIAEREHYRQLYHAQLLRSTELADILRELQQLHESALRNPLPPVSVPIDITGINPHNPSASVELKLARGVSERIAEGDLAIVGRDVVGRVTDVGLTRVSLLPTTHPIHGHVRTSIVPAHPPSDRSPILATVLAYADGKPYLYAECASSLDVQVGDLVVIDDTSWSEHAKGLIAGKVTAINPIDEAPLRNALEITPRRKPRDVARVIILGSAEGSE
ncbi:MAG: hypothetical protein VX615_02910 [Planctomycetota bacterium]|nr:hypothetical protein [Planctomycetota bacterium]